MKNNTRKEIYINLALVKEPIAYGLGFDEAQDALLEAEERFFVKDLLLPLSESFDIIVYSMDLSEKHEYEVECWLIEQDYPIERLSFKPDNYVGTWFDGVLDLIDLDKVSMVFETRQSLAEVFRDNDIKVFEYV